jgi:multiple sugar transport system substrate-binding protein
MQTRRQFIGRGAAIAAAAAVGPTVFTRRAGAAGRLSIVQWSHFVPAYDRWFDPWAKRWGAAHGVEVTVDHVSFADVVPRATAEVAAQSGHDLHMFLGLASAFEEHAVDLSEVARTLEKKHGPPVDLARRSTYNPFSRKQFALSDMWVPDPGDYLKTVWTTIGRVDGPRTWEDLVAAGPEIRRKFPSIQIPVGIGLSQDIDSNMAVRDILWSYGGSVQDDQGNVVLNTPATLDALDYARRLYRGAMTPAVLSWNAASNNQALNARATSYILNSISAYRTAQANKLPIADDIFFTPALRGPGGRQLASEHVMSSYVLWKFSRNQDTAKQFLVDLVGASREAVQASELYNFPSYFGAVADATVPLRERSAAGQAWLTGLTRHDPYGSMPANKLAVLTTALDWSTNLGHPGHANPAVGEVFDTYVLTDMFAKAATAALSPKDALAEANTRVREIFTRWRRKDLVGGGSKDL